MATQPRSRTVIETQSPVSPTGVHTSVPQTAAMPGPPPSVARHAPTAYVPNRAVPMTPNHDDLLDDSPEPQQVHSVTATFQSTPAPSFQTAAPRSHTVFIPQQEPTGPVEQAAQSRSLHIGVLGSGLCYRRRLAGWLVSTDCTTAYPLFEDRNLLGRYDSEGGGSNTVEIDDATVSSEQATIDCIGDRTVLITAPRAINVSKVNGKAVYDRTEIVSGDQLTFGKTTVTLFRLVMPSNTEPAR